MSELKICPFCNGKPMLDEIIGERHKDSDKFLIICTNCMNQTNTYLYKDEAIKAWNTRYENGWIKCSDRLPEKHGYYFCHYIFDNKRCYQDFWFTGSVFSTVNDITHWMPLPSQPIENEK